MKFLKQGGELGVLLFFVLSGFLITHLLLIEKRQTKKINLRKFYSKRVLRIWPLCFLITFLGFAVIPFLGIPFFSIYKFNIDDLLLYILLLANLCLRLGVAIPGIAALWSVAIEEQFYIFWPLVVKKYFAFISAVCVILFLYPLTYLFFNSELVEFLFRTFRFDGMAVGCLVCIIYNTKWFKYFEFLLFNKVSQFIFLGFLVFSFLSSMRFWGISYQVYAIMCGYAILNLAMNKKCIISLEQVWLKELGKISYGLYVYHSSVLYLGFFLLTFTPASMQTGFFYFALFPFLLFAATFLVSKISFICFESYFLRLKSRL